MDELERVLKRKLRRCLREEARLGSPITQNPGDNEPDDKGHRQDDDSGHRVPGALRQPLVPTSEEGDHCLWIIRVHRVQGTHPNAGWRTS
jgi:hypothetical protein